MLYHHTKGENLHISLALRARENMNFPPSGDDITHIRRNKQISSIYCVMSYQHFERMLANNYTECTTGLFSLCDGGKYA